MQTADQFVHHRFGSGAGNAQSSSHLLIIVTISRVAAEIIHDALFQVALGKTGYFRFLVFHKALEFLYQFFLAHADNDAFAVGSEVLNGRSKQLTTQSNLFIVAQCLSVW